VIWKQINTFPGYLVSDTGEVKSTKYWGQFKRQNSEGLLSQRTYKSGYKFVNLYKEGHMYSVKVHRLVAQAFIPNPRNLPQVNHIDEDKGNNMVTNLEWVTARENLVHNNLHIRTHLKQKRKIGSFSKNGTLLMRFDSLTDAANYIFKCNLSKSLKSCITNICVAAKRDGTKYCYGSYWKWLEASKRRDTKNNNLNKQF
jgi:hypothetical protein